jgi:hypothetical protein
VSKLRRFNQQRLDAYINVHDIPVELRANDNSRRQDSPFAHIFSGQKIGIAIK